MKNSFISKNNENQSLFFITEDTKLIEEISKNTLSFDQIEFCTTKNDISSFLKESNNYEFIVFDIRSEENIIEFSAFYNYIVDIETTVILLGEDIDHNFLSHKYSKIFTFLPIDNNYKFISTNIELCKRHTNSKKRIDFRDGISFDYNTNSLVNNKQPIEFTKSETMIIKLLIKNLNTVVEYKVLEDYLWKNKNFTKDTLRNKIRNIRKKTNATFIRNVSKKGYILNSI